MAGHEVRVAAADEFRERLRELEPDAVVGRPELLRAIGPLEGVRSVSLSRPVNMEELRRALHDE
jgi:hypothetical protein